MEPPIGGFLFLIFVFLALIGWLVFCFVVRFLSLRGIFNFECFMKVFLVRNLGFLLFWGMFVALWCLLLLWAELMEILNLVLFSLFDFYFIGLLESSSLDFVLIFSVFFLRLLNRYGLVFLGFIYQVGIKRYPFC